MSALRRLVPQLVALAVVLALSAAAFPGFFDISIANGRLYGSLIDILNRGAPVALLSIGMCLVIATRGIDLSVGAVVAITGAVAASAITSGFGVLGAVGLALVAGTACGIWNGILVALFGVQPFVATLILMVAGRGVAQLITEGTILTFTDPAFIALGSGTVLTVPTPVVIWLCVGAGVIALVRLSALGLLIEAIGINLRASRLAGINARVLLVAVYVASGLCAALAGVIATADIRGADANNAGLWLELDAILAVVIGGNALLGGRFSISAALLGAMVIQAVNTGIITSGFPPEFNLLIKALIVLAILVLQSPAVGGRLGSLRRGRAAPVAVAKPAQ